MKVKDFDRPNCIECGSPRVGSKGPNWMCKDCGRFFSKFNRRELAKSKLEQRPPCPYCGGTAPYISASSRYTCRYCHRSYYMNKTEDEFFIPEEVKKG